MQPSDWTVRLQRGGHWAQMREVQVQVLELSRAHWYADLVIISSIAYHTYHVCFQIIQLQMDANVGDPFGCCALEYIIYSF